MYSEELEALISAALADGVLTDKEKQILTRRAIAEGIDPDEFEMVLDARLLMAQKAQSPTPKSNKVGDLLKCPACGATYVPGTAICPECGHVFSGIKASRSSERLFELIQEFDQNNKPKQAKGLGDALLRMYNLKDDGMADIARRKMSLIQSFPVPNAREDLLDLLSVLQPMANHKGPKEGFTGGGMRGTAIGGKIKEDVSYGYWLLFCNCINKAKISFAGDAAFKPFFDFYDKSSSRGFFSFFKK